MIIVLCSGSCVPIVEMRLLIMKNSNNITLMPQEIQNPSLKLMAIQNLEKNVSF